MQGSNFHIPVLSVADFTELQEARIPLYVTTLSNRSISHKELVAEEDFALVMGNEGAGVSDQAVAVADQLVHIEILWTRRVFECRSGRRNFDV